ncbi:MAG: hypothetical protein ACI8R4_000842 [Paracoccaceae bacterium]
MQLNGSFWSLNSEKGKLGMGMLRKHLIVPVLALVANGIGLAPLLAEESGEYEIGEAEGPHIVELFMGNTRGETHTGYENAFSAGVSYNYLLNPTVSVGVMAEYASDPLDSWVVGAPIVFRVGEGWQLTTMPGIEREHGESEFLFRLGVGYEIEMSGYSLKPEVNADFVNGEVAFVTGVSIGFRF